MKNTFIALLVIVLIGFGVYFIVARTPEMPETPDSVATTTPATTTPTTVESEPETSIGMSAQGREIEIRHFGTGDVQALFVGGIHGAYSPNTSALAYELIDYLEANPNAVPAGIRVSVIPVANPDGLAKVAGSADREALASVPSAEATRTPGRFNANNVDLNRNFDCEWQATGMWRQTEVSGGSAAFSEPEAQALRDYMTKNTPDAVVVWYSAAGGVYASACGGSVAPETLALMNTYASASGYPANESFDFYEITGDMTNWLAKQRIPAVSVLLTDHAATEWEKNKKGIEAVIASLAD